MSEHRVDARIHEALDPGGLFISADASVHPVFGGFRSS